MARIKIIVNKPMTDGSLPVVIRLSHQYTTTYIRLSGMYVSDKNEFDKGLSRFTPKKKGYKTLNKTLQEADEKAEDILVRLVSNNSFTFQRFRDLYNGKKTGISNSIVKAYNKKIIELESVEKYGTRIIYADSLAAFKRFTGDRTFDEIDYSLLKKYANNLEQRDVSGNTIHLRLKNLRALHFDYCNQIDTPFPTVYRRYNISQHIQETTKRGLTKEQLTAVFDYKPVSSFEFFAIDIWKFSFLSRGMNLSDIARLTPSSIIDGCLIYKRVKTGTNFTVTLSNGMQAIINRYSNDKYLFPILKPNHNPKQCIKTRNLSINRILKRISLKLQIPTFTFYAARHSWASLSRENGVSIEQISAGLGHSDLKTTAIYLKGFATKQLDAITTSLLDGL